MDLRGKSKWRLLGAAAVFAGVGDDVGNLMLLLSALELRSR